MQRISSMKDSWDKYSDPSQIATKCNNFLTNIRPSSANNIPPTQISHKQYLVGSYDNRLLLSPTSPSEISSIALSLKNSKCEGHDSLSISPMKETIDLLAPPLSHIFNLSFASGVFPDKFKIAKIYPSLKMMINLTFPTIGPYLSLLI